MADSHSSCFSLNVLFMGLIGLLLAAAHFPPHVLCTASSSMELMHWDHPESSLHNTASTASRAEYLHSAGIRNPNSPVIIDSLRMTLTSLGFPFVVKNVYIGPLRKKVDLIFAFNRFLVVQCIPCDCYKSTQPKYNTNTSPFFSKRDCRTPECRMINGRCSDFNNCQYTEELIPPVNRFVFGTFGIDRIKIGERTLNISLGCIHRTEGNFPRESIGLTGLGPGPFSLARQLGTDEIMFSYCLPALVNRTSTLIFGPSAYVPDPSPYVSTAMDTSDDAYRVTVEKIEIDGFKDHPIIITSSSKYVIDPNTRFTHVARGMLDRIIEVVKKVTPFPTIPRDRINTIHELCFNTATGRKDHLMPEITFFMENNAEFVLQVENSFEIVDTYAMCLTILSTDSSRGKPIIGSLAQLNRQIVIDITHRKFSFRQENCALT